MYKKDIKVDLERNNEESSFNKNKKGILLLILLLITAVIVVVFFNKIQFKKETPKVEAPLVTAVTNVKSDTVLKSNTVSQKDESSDFYEVKKNDNLWSIAKRVYGASINWVLIYDANRESIPNPDIIKQNQRLLMPKLTENSGNKIKEIISELKDKGYFEKVLTSKLNVGKLNVVNFNNKSTLTYDDKDDLLKEETSKLAKQIQESNEKLLKEEIKRKDSIRKVIELRKNEIKKDSVKENLIPSDTIDMGAIEQLTYSGYNAKSRYNKYKYSKNPRIEARKRR